MARVAGGGISSQMQQIVEQQLRAEAARRQAAEAARRQAHAQALAKAQAMAQARAADATKKAPKPQDLNPDGFSDLGKHLKDVNGQAQAQNNQNEEPLKKSVEEAKKEGYDNKGFGRGVMGKVYDDALNAVARFLHLDKVVHFNGPKAVQEMHEYREGILGKIK